MPNLTGKHTAIVCLAAAVVYFLSNPKPSSHYDYPFRVAENVLRGSIGFSERPPSWLNEFVPFEGLWYSVFPLGSVLTMLPFAVLKIAGVISGMPAASIAAVTTGFICFFLLKIAGRYELTPARAILMSLGTLFGTWMWTNLTFGGAWQLTLGFAMLGELGAIYFTVYDRRPLIAGAFFALAFGNRTEVLLTAPLLMYLLSREGIKKGSGNEIAGERPAFKSALPTVGKFCIVPFMLGVATLWYNHARFGSPFDFGYARIPGVLEEPWYNHGIFSPYYIPRQAWEMLLKPWELKPNFPFVVPDPFSASILIGSPFILFALRLGARDRVLKYVAWAAIAVMTLVLWMHGNSGGWQFGYRYWMVCLPWLFVILLETAPKKISRLEWAAYGFSFAANAYATWLFNWTNYLRM